MLPSFIQFAALSPHPSNTGVFESHLPVVYVFSLYDHSFCCVAFSWLLPSILKQNGVSKLLEVCVCALQSTDITSWVSPAMCPTHPGIGSK